MMTPRGRPLFRLWRRGFGGESPMLWHGQKERQIMRRLLTLLATVMVLMGLIAAPAAADKPFVDGPFTAGPFTDIDPCTGDPMEVTITFTVFVHEGHNNNFVIRFGDRSGSTDTGYVLLGGHDNFREDNNGVSASFKDVWRNSENGDKMQATGRLREVGSSAVIDSFDLRCVGGPTA
jgi:hypothetical protein